MDFIEAKALRHFLAVVRSGSIRGAADRLHVAPSVVSRQIADLEHSLGLVLFARTARGAVLTEAGELLLEHGKRLSEEHDFLAEQLARLSGVEQGRVRIVCGEGFVGDLIENGLKAFLAVYPGIRYELTLAGTDEIVETIIGGETDIGIAYNPGVDTRIRSLAIHRQPLCLIAGPEEPLLSRKDLKLVDCLDRPMALMTKGHGVRQLVGQIAADSGRAVAPVLETPSIDALRRFAIAGLGVTFLPAFAVDNEIKRGTLCAAELADATLAQASAHLMVRAHRRLPISVERLATCLSQAMSAFRD